MRQMVKELLLHYEELRRHLVARLRDTDRAADLAQSSFEQVYASVLRAPPASKPIESPRALLYRVAHNLCIDEARHRHVVEAWERSHLVTHEQFVAPSPEFLFAQKQLVERVAAQIALLPPRRREVFLLFKAYGHTQREIAQRLDISEAAVVKHVVRATLDCARAFALLRSQLPDSPPGPGQAGMRPALAEEYC